jgi:glycyl-tRNA synthetase
VTGIAELIGLTATESAIASQAAHLAKADLGTRMVVEMTSLQGVMGRDYALRENYPPEVASAIFEHWLPRFAGDQLPISGAGTVLALSDRLDSLVGLFAVGLAPKSTADPYGLRRAALGIIQILAHKGISLDLVAAVELAAVNQPIEVTPAARSQALEFIAGRLRVWLSEQGYAADVITAVLGEQAANPYRALIGVRQLTDWTKRAVWEPLLDGFARCVRITRSEGERYPVDAALFQQPEEHALYAAYQSAQAHLTDTGDIDEFLNAFSAMIPAVTAYFGTGKGDGVLVNTDDAAVRRNRIGLLQAISAMQNGRADLSQLAGF